MDDVESAGLEKLNITVDPDQYTDRELEFRAVSTLQSMKVDTVDLVLSVLKKQSLEVEESKAASEILAFAIFNCWHIILNTFKNEEKADLFNSALAEVFKYEFKKDDQIFTKYYEPMPTNDNFDEMTWKFWLFGKAIAMTSDNPNSSIVFKTAALMNFVISSINRSLNLTLNLKDSQLRDFMVMVEQKAEKA